jgi:RHH-type proline utilization regulon transcriptional repressor/proline dehydrogenase/delta 1-pyrroline-5-carboxylate dehydrogenase
VLARIRAGNVYVNRNIVGAVVGVQPFGGEALSGTGPKAGGPWLMQRLRHDPSGRALPPASITSREDAPRALLDLEQWAVERGQSDLAALCERYRLTTPIGCRHVLGGPTGESNVLDYRPRRRLLCLGADTTDGLHQLAAVAATGSRALLSDAPWARALFPQLPQSLRDCIDWFDGGEPAEIDGVLRGRDQEDGGALRRALAAREGARIRIVEGGPEYPLHWMVVERTVSTNTAAAGGNASLLTLEA